MQQSSVPSRVPARRRATRPGSSPQKQQHGNEVCHGAPGTNEDKATRDVAKDSEAVNINRHQEQLGTQKGRCTGEEHELEQKKRAVPHPLIQPVKGQTDE
jgi:hypothetical protein